MRKKLNKFYLWYSIVTILIVAICATIELQSFKMEKDFCRDLRISLPKYTIKNTEISDVCEDNGELIHMVKTFVISIDDKIPQKTLDILSAEKRGWKADGQESYYLHRTKGGDGIYAHINPTCSTLHIKYHYAYLLSGLPVFSIIILGIMMHLLLIICVAKEITLAVKNRRSINYYKK